MGSSVDKINHHIKKLAINQEKIINKIRNLDKCVRVILNSHLTVNETMSEVSKDIEVLKSQKNDNVKAIKMIDKKIEEINCEIMSRKVDNIVEERTISHENINSKVEVDFTLSCSICEDVFDKYCELENHLNVVHGQQKDNMCSICGKGFVLKWRLNKHLKIHTSNSIKPCRYFVSKSTCPFEEIGCKFLHKMPDVTEASKDNNEDDNQVDALENSTSKNQIHCKNCDDNIQCSECVVREWNAKYRC